MITVNMIKDLREKTSAGMLDCKKALEQNDGNMEKAIDWLREKGISKAAKKSDRIAAEGLVEIISQGNKATVLEVNCETDFVANNDEFKSLIDTISTLLISNDVETVEDALTLNASDGTLNETIINKTAKIGEKISFRRFLSLTKEENETFGIYKHMGGRIATLVITENTSEEIAKDVAMHAAAMKPSYVNRKQVTKEDLEREREVQKQIALNEGKPENIAEKMVEGRINKFYKEVCLEEQPFVKDSDITVLDYVEKSGGKIKFMVRYEVGEGMEKRQDNFAEEVMNQMK